MKERIVILDPGSHTVFFEDIDTDLLESKYEGEEEKYILDNYTLESEFWTWDYAPNVQYIDENGDVYEVDIDSFIKN